MGRTHSLTSGLGIKATRTLYRQAPHPPHTRTYEGLGRGRDHLSPGFAYYFQIRKSRPCEVTGPSLNLTAVPFGGLGEGIPSIKPLHCQQALILARVRGGQRQRTFDGPAVWNPHEVMWKTLLTFCFPQGTGHAEILGGNPQFLSLQRHSGRPSRAQNPESDRPSKDLRASTM